MEALVAKEHKSVQEERTTSAAEGKHAFLNDVEMIWYKKLSLKLPSMIYTNK